MAEMLTRRQFLGRSFARGAEAFGLSYSLRNQRLALNLAALASYHPESAHDSKEQEIFKSIVSFREYIGLSGLPLELQANEAEEKRTDWENIAKPFINNLPEQTYSFGQRLLEFASQLMGESTRSHLIHEAFQSPSAPITMFVDPFNKRFSIPPIIVWVQPFVVDRGDGETFNDYAAHELGHQIDPSYIAGIYPYQTLLRIEYGKWLMLSQVFNIKGYFLEPLESKKYPEFTYSKGLTQPLGESLIYYFLAERDILDRDIKEEGVNTIWRFIYETAIQQGQIPSNPSEEDVASLVYNKDLCENVGREVLKAIRRGQLTLSGKLLLIYQSNLEYSLIEQFAEMFRVALLKPEVNRVVTEGLRHILSALHGREVDTEQIKQTIKYPSSESLGRNIQEEVLHFNNSDFHPRRRYYLEDDPDPLISETTKDYLAFVSGILPGWLSLPTDQKLLLEKFAAKLAQVTAVYPQLRDTFGTKLPDLGIFNPKNLHYYEADNLIEATEPNFIKGMLINLRNNSLSDRQMMEIKRKLQLLENPR